LELLRSKILEIAAIVTESLDYSLEYGCESRYAELSLWTYGGFATYAHHLTDTSAVRALILAEHCHGGNARRNLVVDASRREQLQEFVAYSGRTLGIQERREGDGFAAFATIGIIFVVDRSAPRAYDVIPHLHSTRTAE
jgi:hypothetical protein